MEWSHDRKSKSVGELVSENPEWMRKTVSPADVAAWVRIIGRDDPERIEPSEYVTLDDADGSYHCCCIIGHALVELGVPKQSLYWTSDAVHCLTRFIDGAWAGCEVALRGASAPWGETFEWLRRVQLGQDQGLWWGAAIDYADSYPLNVVAPAPGHQAHVMS